MTIEEALVTYLKTKTALTALISTKIYPMQIPQSVSLPAIAYTKISSLKPRGAITGHYGLNIDTIQLSIYSKTYSNLKLITEQIKSALLNYSGVMGTVSVQGCFETFEEYNSETVDSDIKDSTQIFGAILEYEIIYPDNG